MWHAVRIVPAVAPTGAADGPPTIGGGGAGAPAPLGTTWGPPAVLPSQPDSLAVTPDHGHLQPGYADGGAQLPPTLFGDGTRNVPIIAAAAHSAPAAAPPHLARTSQSPPDPPGGPGPSGGGRGPSLPPLPIDIYAPTDTLTTTLLHPLLRDREVGGAACDAADMYALTFHSDTTEHDIRKAYLCALQCHLCDAPFTSVLWRTLRRGGWDRVRLLSDGIAAYATVLQCSGDAGARCLVVLKGPPSYDPPTTPTRSAGGTFVHGVHPAYAAAAAAATAMTSGLGRGGVPFTDYFAADGKGPYPLFSAYVDALWAHLVDTIPSHATITVTGHGVGGTMAQLAACRLHDAGYRVAAVYSFAAFPCGHERFAAVANKKVGKLVHAYVAGGERHCGARRVGRVRLRPIGSLIYVDALGTVYLPPTVTESVVRKDRKLWHGAPTLYVYVQRLYKIYKVRL